MASSDSIGSLEKRPESAFQDRFFWDASPPQNGNNSWQSCRRLRWGIASVTLARITTLLVAGFASVATLQLSCASAQWWQRAPADFEECARTAEKTATPGEKSAALAQCSSNFAGRRKPGGGYTYYDFMQDRSFDIAGPNP